MPEEVLFETESARSRSEIASLLRTVADNLDAGGDITLTAGEESVIVTPPASPTFEVKVERETATSGASEMSVEFELEWPENGDASGDLDIE